MKLMDEIAEGESYGLEFKLVPNEERIKYLKTAVAFANGKGGRLLFGVANDGSVHGIAKDRVFQEMDGIVNSISDACSPHVPIDIGIKKVAVDDAGFAVRMNVYRNNATDDEVVNLPPLENTWVRE